MGFGVRNLELDSFCTSCGADNFGGVNLSQCVCLLEKWECYNYLPGGLLSPPEGEAGTECQVLGASWRFSPLPLSAGVYSLPALLTAVRNFSYVADGDMMVPGEFNVFR